MKKLLSLLSVLTISGIAVPTTIAASSYKKQENLIRNKRENNNIKMSVEKINSFSEIKEINKKIEYNNKVYLLAKNYIDTAGSNKRSFLYEISKNSIRIIMEESSIEINDFCIDNEGNIYIASDSGINKYDKYDIKKQISNIKSEVIGIDNEGKIIFKPKKSDSIYILSKEEVKNFPKEKTDLDNIKKITLNNNDKFIKIERFYFDMLNNLYISSDQGIFMSINESTTYSKVSNINVKIDNFYNFGDKIYVFVNKKIYTLKTGQTSIKELINFSEVNDYLLSQIKENFYFYIADKNGIHKLEVSEDDEKETIFNSSTPVKKIAVDKSNNIFYILENKNEMFFLRNNISNEIDFTNNDNGHWSIAQDANKLKPELLFCIDKKVYFIKKDEGSNYKLILFNFDRKVEWITEEEKYINELDKEAKRLKQERLDKERLVNNKKLSKEAIKQWQIEKLEQLKNKLEERKNNNKATSFETKLLACLRNNISNGFAAGFGLLAGFAGGAVGTAFAPGAGTVAFGMSAASIGTAIGKTIGNWIGGVIGDYVQSSVPEGEGKCSL